MKQFFKQLLYILCIVSAFSALFICIYGAMNRAQISHVNGSTLILGDSQSQNGFDPQYFPNGTVNYANSAESFYIMKEKLKVFTKKLKIKLLILPVTNLNLNSKIDKVWIQNDTTFNEKYSLYFGIWKMKQPSGLNKSKYPKIEQLNKLLYKAIYTFERRLLLRKVNVLGGFVANQGKFNQKLECKTSTNTIVYSKLQLKELKEIQQICKEKDIKLILVNMPKYCKAELRLEKVFKLESNTVFIDCHDWLIGRSDCFADFNHLNEKGAKLFSKRFAHILPELDK